MFMRSTTVLAGGVAAAALCSIAPAGPLEIDRLPADTVWVAHVDFEQVRKSTIGQLMLEDDMGLELDDMREDIEEEIGFDPFEDAMDLTLHGGRDSEDGVVVIMTATPVLDSLVQHVRDEGKDYERLVVDGYALDTWMEPGEPGKTMYLYMTSIHGDTQRRAVASDSVSRLLLTLKTMADEAPNVTDVKGARLNIAPRLGSLIYVQCASLHAFPDMELDEHIKDAASRVTFEISEHQNRSRVELAATADNEDHAKTVSEILQGLIGLGKLITGAEDDMAPLNNMLRATRSTNISNEVSIRFEVASDELGDLLEDHHHGGRDRHFDDDDHDRHHNHEMHDDHDGHDHHEHGPGA